MRIRVVRAATAPAMACSDGEYPSSTKWCSLSQTSS